MKKFTSILIGTLGGLIISSAAFAVIINRFDDVPSDHFALEAIEWAAEEGLVKGDDNANTFRPNEPVSRAELVTVLQRYDEKMMKEFYPNKAFFDEIEQLLASGATVEEVEDPGFELPREIDANQMKLYFKMENIYFALVFRPFSGLSLGTLSIDDSISAVLVAEKNQDHWSLLLEIKDTNIGWSSEGNNPYYLWIKNGELFLSIVDINGAGSGEGVEKIYKTNDGWNWKILNDCYDFSPRGYIDEEGDEHYGTSWLKNLSQYGRFQTSSLLDQMRTGKEQIEFQKSLGFEVSEEWKEDLLYGCKDDVELILF